MLPRHGSRRLRDLTGNEAGATGPPIQATFPSSAEPLVFHGGSNQKNLASILLQPRHDRAMVLLTNISGPKAEDALSALARELYDRFFRPR